MNIPDPAYGFWLSLPVQWGQTNLRVEVPTDLVLQWVESGRVALMEALGLMSFSGHTISVILGRTELDLFYPVTFPDDIRVGTRVAEVFEDRFVVDTVMHSTRQQRVVAQNRAVLVVYDYALLRRVPAPDWLRNNLSSLLAEGQIQG